jgi:SAM-dependent methyltransferase
MYRLFHQFAHRYDLHTPPNHYQHDHALVIAEALRVAPTACRLLDIGCGTGVFLERAVAAGIDGHGIDAASEMIDVARQRLGERVRLQRMQEMSDENLYDVVCSLSWTVHYAGTASELDDILRRCRRGLRPGGLLVLQVANDEQMTGSVHVDREPSLSGEVGDTFFIHRFRPVGDSEHSVIADYVYASCAHGELLCEHHQLRFANPRVIVDALQRAGFQAVDVVNSAGVSPFVIGTAA